MIDIYIGTESEQYNKLWQSSCGIILDYSDGDTKKHRIMGFDLDVAEPVFAKAQAIRLALAAIHRSLRRTPTIIHLEDDELLKQLVQPSEKYNELLRWYKAFGDIGFIVEHPNYPPILACRRIAIKVLENLNYDSGTLAGPAVFTEIK